MKVRLPKVIWQRRGWRFGHQSDHNGRHLRILPFVDLHWLPNDERGQIAGVFGVPVELLPTAEERVALHEARVRDLAWQDELFYLAWSRVQRSIADEMERLLDQEFQIKDPRGILSTRTLSVVDMTDLVRRVREAGETTIWVAPRLSPDWNVLPRPPDFTALLREYRWDWQRRDPEPPDFLRVTPP